MQLVRGTVGAAGQYKCVASGMKAPVPSVITADISMSAELVPMQVTPGKSISHHPVVAPTERKVGVSSAVKASDSEQPYFKGNINWTTEDFLAAHRGREFVGQGCTT